MTVPPPQRRPLRPTARTAAERWRRFRRPLTCAVVSISPLPVTLAAAAGRTLLLLSGLTALAVLAVVARLAVWRSRSLRQRAAVREAEQAVTQAYDRWIEQEAQRGSEALDRWRRRCW